MVVKSWWKVPQRKRWSASLATLACCVVALCLVFIGWQGDSRVRDLLFSSVDGPWIARDFRGSDPRWAFEHISLAAWRRLHDASAATGGNSTELVDCICEADVEDAVEGEGLPLFISLPLIVVLVLLSGLFSGLTLGLMGLDLIGLQIVMKGDNAKLAKCAEKIAPVREKGNQLLCTLLLGNVAVNSALSILTAELASGLIGFLVSTALIVIFGEILPQATCARYALQIGARTVPIVKVLMIMFWLATKPVSSILDLVLGEEMGTVHSSQELMEMLKLQISLGATDEEEGAIARQVAEGALSFRDKKAVDVMQPFDDVYMLSSEARLGYTLIREIFETGFSRIPVYGKTKHDFAGLLVAKDLMLADPEDEMRVGDFIMIFNRKVECFFKETLLVETLEQFKKGGTHMGLVRECIMTDPIAPRMQIVGVMTFEDVMEEILQEEIVDETDVYVDVDLGVKITDGREKRQLNLGAFNPIWKERKDSLSNDEISAIAAHLCRSVFNPASGMELRHRTVEWLVTVADVENHKRAAGKDEQPLAEDWLYTANTQTDKCVVVLQGEVGLLVGKESIHSTVGTYSVLAKRVLKEDKCTPDFSAYIQSDSVRLLVITRAQFLEAQELARDPQALEFAISELAQAAAGEVSRSEAKDLRAHEAGARASAVERLGLCSPPAMNSASAPLVFRQDSPLAVRYPRRLSL